MKKILRFVAATFILISLSSVVLASNLTDGVYRAEYKNFDKYGWKQFLELEVKDGKIISVNSDSINKKGSLKSQDAYYNSSMKKKSGTSPKEYKPVFEKQLLEKQSVENLDGVAGASHSFQNFRALAESILENASQGKNEKIILD